jgi:hypothetical protein
MRTAAAFALGLWTGAVLAGAVGAYYFKVLDQARSGASPQVHDKLETRLQFLQQEQARAAAEAQRLKETVAELKSDLAAREYVEARRQQRQVRVRETPPAEPAVESWITAAVAGGDMQVLPRLEQAAVQGDAVALDAVALLADRDHGEALTRVWSAPDAGAVTRARATFLLAATLEVVPPAIELLQSLFTAGPPGGQLLEAALTGLGNPDFVTRLTQSDTVAPPPHFQPNYAMRLKVLEALRPSVTDEQVLAVSDRVRAKLLQRAQEAGQVTQ